MSQSYFSMVKGKKMRTAFDAWAQREGQIVRRREDKPEEYLVSETQRRWVIWQAALAHAASVSVPTGSAAQRERVLDEVLAACAQLDRDVGIDDVLTLIASLKTPARKGNRKEGAKHAL
jgi:hypothetical protein